MAEQASVSPPSLRDSRPSSSGRACYAHTPGPARTVRIDLAGLDALSGAALALFCWSDVRPLKGVLGLVDWRLGGAISRAVMAHIFLGHDGDTLLLPAPPRMGVARVFVFGLGPCAHAADAPMATALRRAADVMRAAAAQAWVWGAPASGPNHTSVEPCFVRLVGALDGAGATVLVAR